MDKSKGYINIYRSFFDHWIWAERRSYSRAEAWVDLLQNARYLAGNSKIVSGNSVVLYGRGEQPVSVRGLQERWGWGSKDKVSAFLKLLQADGMITIRSEAKQTILSIVAYDEYNPVYAKRQDNETDIPLPLPERDTENGKDNGKDIIQDDERTEIGQKSDDERTHYNISNINNTGNSGNSDHQAPGLTAGDGAEKKNEEVMFILDDETGKEYIQVQRYIFSTKLLSKISKQLKPEEFKKLRENWETEQILAVLEKMENFRGTRNYETINKSCEAWLKKEFGTSEDNSVRDEMEKIYRSFCDKNGTPAKITREDRNITLRKINEYLRTVAKPEPTDENVLRAWKAIFESWACLDNYTRTRVRLIDIEKNIQNILAQIRQHKNAQNNGNNNTPRNHQTGGNTADNSQPKNFSGVSGG